MIIAFDIGGSLIKSASVAGIDEIVPIGDAPTPHHDFDAFVSRFVPFTGITIRGILE